MKEVHDVAVTYDEAFEKFQTMIEDSRRAWAAKLLRSYPDRQLLIAAAEGLRVTIGVDAVEVNSVSPQDQTTIAKAPVAHERTIPAKESLCVLTVGAGEPLMVSDIEHDPVLEEWAGQTAGLKAWASTPIMVEGVAAGTVCALETAKPRDWTEADQFVLEGAARRISALINEWLPKADKSLLAN